MRLTRYAETIFNLQFCSSSLGELCACIILPLSSLWNICVSWGPFRFRVHILFSLGLSFHTTHLIIWSSILRFHFGTTVRFYVDTVIRVFFCGLGDLGVAIFLKLKGNIISDLTLISFSTCSECLLNFMGRLGSLIFFVSVKGLLDFVLLWLKFACVWQHMQRTYSIFNFALPVWGNCALALFYHYPVSETFVSAESLLDFVFIFYSHWG